MSFFQETIQNMPCYRQLQQAKAAGISPVALTGCATVQKAQLALALAQDDRHPLLLLTGEEAEARRLCDDINTMADTPTAQLFPAKELILAPAEGVSTAYLYTRLGVLSAVQNGTCSIVTASIEALMQPVMPPEQLRDTACVLKSGDELPIETLRTRLIAMGYQRCDAVEGAGQFSIRGDLVDIFSAQAPFPYRLEFWGDEIESISPFDPETQRRTDPVPEMTLIPARETLCDPTLLASQIRQLANSLRGKYAAAAKQQLLQEAQQLEDGLELVQIDKYYPLIHETPALLTDYGFSTVLLSESASITETARTLLARYREDAKVLLEDGVLCRGLTGYYQEPEIIQNRWQGCFCVAVQQFLQGGSHIEYQKLLSMECVQLSAWSGELRQLTEDLKGYLGQHYAVMLLAGSEKTLPILQKDLQESGIPCVLATEELPTWKPNQVYLMSGSLSGGYVCPETKTVIITQGRTVRTGNRKRRQHKAGQALKSLSDLTPGDLVVHTTHGIGRFLGIRKLELEGMIKDYITIQYQGNENLYVPVTQMDLVSRYISGRDDSHVKLHRLSASDWQKTRNQVKRAVKDMAKELTALYAKREKSQGFAFYPDDGTQADFEARFPYVETDDQLQSIAEIKADMEQPRPMDRLLCGDVGFGKTEVALRAAMKCILSGKQCAILVPTTVLAMQHYQTAVRRFEAFPVNIVLLSRYNSPKQTRENLKKIRTGVADLVIGTHRVVQKDVQFKSLGLAIVDEEQRFGVAHKEKFKEMFPGVDMLTLSATPIPRTLNMAMSGMRDMSVIAEPPQDRYPVQTCVMEYQLGVLVQAMRRELKRGGQVYYIHNRVETMEQTAAKLQEVMPEARIAIANGQMDEKTLSEIWQQLVEAEIDILVCTTIIETGVDVPNVNTLIIERADCFGLSQLYQLRGRVGRSNRRGYAYFTFRRDQVLSEEASRRLTAMREFTQFGSGFQIAMRDLEIRGAGSLLGGKQHGHMEAVGYDMYLQLLQEAIAEEKGTPIQHTSACVVDVQMEAHIPDTYIQSLSQRLDIYRKIAAIETEQDQSDLLDELIDRYGDPPNAIIGLLHVALLRNQAAQLGITEITQRNHTLYFYTEHPTQAQITALASQYRGQVIFNGLQNPYIGIKLQAGQAPVAQMKAVLSVMRNAEIPPSQPEK
jgi:transcription-repair coupling factor (superfamily II helicase)